LNARRFDDSGCLMCASVQTMPSRKRSVWLSVEAQHLGCAGSERGLAALARKLRRGQAAL